MSKYNLLAAQPLDATSFSHACLSLSPPLPHGIDIVSLDLASLPRRKSCRFVPLMLQAIPDDASIVPFYMPLKTVSQATTARVSFEISYSATTSLSPTARTAPSSTTFPCIPPTPTASSSSSTTSVGNAARRNLIANAKEVVRVTNAKSVLISSGAGTWSELRAPDDLVSLASLFGLPPDAARHAVSSMAQTVIRRGQSTRSTYRGVVSDPVVITTAPLPAYHDPPTVEIDPAAAAPSNLGKRSRDDDDDGEGEGVEAYLMPTATIAAGEKGVSASKKVKTAEGDSATGT